MGPTVSWSVCGRTLRAVDHQHVHWSLCRLELQPELLLDSRENRWRIGRRRRRRRSAGWKIASDRVDADLRRVRQLHIVGARQSGFVDDDAADEARQARRKRWQRLAAYRQPPGADHEAALRPL